MQMEEFHGNEELFTPKKVDIVHHTPDSFNAERGREGGREGGRAHHSFFLSVPASLPPVPPSLAFVFLCCASAILSEIDRD